MKKLGDAEFEIMKILWRSSGTPLTSNQILDELEGIKNWKLASLMTALARLAEKGFVYCDRSTRTNYYTALIEEKDYKLEESQSFLGKLYDNSVQKLIAGLYNGKKMSNKDIQELREYLDELEKEEH